MLRIEDTDRARFVEGSVENLMHVLASVGLIPDEGPNNPGDKGPYFQSERLDIYQEYIKTLLNDDKAYYCFCSSERLTELREEQQSLGLPTKYDKKCRYCTPEETKEQLDAGKPFTIRLKVPDNTDITFEDAVRGKITIPSKDVDEQVLMKTDGYPTYHFAVVVDDYLMGVTDIIRGDEWIPSTPKHVLLYNAFGWEMPKFSHVPPLLWEGWKKLSKRTGDVSVESFLAKWFLPEAMLNYISLLGWNPKTTQEIFSMSELIEKFKLSDVHKAWAIFEEERMAGFNAQYIKSYETQTLWNKIKTYLGRYDNEYLEEISEFPQEYILKILEELKTRMKKLEDFKPLTQFFLTDIADLNPELIVNPKMKVTTLAEAKQSLQVALELLENRDISLDTPEDIKQAFIDIIASKEMKNGQVLWPVRVALSMQKFSSGALELVYIFGREKSIERIQKVLKQM
jgi:nondiscriminating glutamyl-tRNA synthetase